MSDQSGVAITSFALRRAKAFASAARGEAFLPATPMAEISITRHGYQSILLSSPTSDEMVAAALLYYLAPLSLDEMRQLMPTSSDEQGRATDSRRSLSSMRPLLEAGALVSIESARKSERVIPLRIAGAWESRPIPTRPASPRPPSRREAYRVIKWCRAMIDALRVEATGDTLAVLAWIADGLRGKLTDRKTLPRGRRMSVVLEEIDRWGTASSIDQPQEWEVTAMWARWLEGQTYPPEVIPFWPAGDDR